MTHIGDGLLIGNAVTGYLGPGAAFGVSPSGGRGVGPAAQGVMYDIVPLTFQTANIATITAAGTVGVLAAGAGTTLVTNARGESVIQLDVPRTLRFTGTNAGDTMNLTVVGYDVYGVKMSEVRAGPGNATVTTPLKAFYQILSFTAASAVTANVTLGTGDKLGLPFACTDAGYLDNVGWAAALARDAGTFVAADATAASTTTGDVRGTYLPSSATNGTRRLVLGLLMPITILGYNAASRTAAVGVDQNLAGT